MRDKKRWMNLDATRRRARREIGNSTKGRGVNFEIQKKNVFVRSAPLSLHLSHFHVMSISLVFNVYNEKIKVRRKKRNLLEFFFMRLKIKGKQHLFYIRGESEM